MKIIPLILLTILLPMFANATECEPLPHADTLLRPGVIVLLGEIHGTEQGPALVANLTCRALKRSLDVNVGLEIPITEQPRIDRYLKSAGTNADRDSLIGGAFWQRDYQDGRSSQAMAGLIESLRQMAFDTSNTLRVLALDNPDAPEGRDWFMAQRLIAAPPDSPKGITIALTGNIHTRLTMGNHFDPEYEPMGYVVWLHRPENEVIALEIVHSGGTAWVDTGESGQGVFELSGQDGEPGIELYPAATGEPYSGRCHVRAITASLPAKDE